MRISLAGLIAHIPCTVRLSGNSHQLPALHAVKSQGKLKTPTTGQSIEGRIVDKFNRQLFPFGRLELALRIDTAIVGLQSGDTAVHRPFLGRL